MPTLAGTGLNVDYYGNSALHGTPMRTATAPNLELELDLTAVSERGRECLSQSGVRSVVNTNLLLLCTCLCVALGLPSLRTLQCSMC